MADSPAFGRADLAQFDAELGRALTHRGRCEHLGVRPGHARWRGRDPGAVPLLEVDTSAAKRLINTLLGSQRGGRELTEAEGAELLAAYGIEVWPATRVSDLEQARAAAATIGWPVALKAADEVLRHRADLGGVRLDLSGDAELTEAYRSITERLGTLGRHNVSIEVQAMAPTGAACVVTGLEDELYGPIVGFGMAGDAVELLDDVAFRIPPLTDADVANLERAASGYVERGAQFRSELERVG